MRLIAEMLADVERFNVDILGINPPSTPTRLTKTRKRYSNDHLQEELDEFYGSDTIEEEADALIDLIYVALGRLVEMGLAPKALFDEVHAANMAKKRGAVSKRPHSQGHDAIKPPGWTPPNLTPFVSVNRADLLAANALGLIRRTPAEGLFGPACETDDFGPVFDLMAEARPKIVVLGHGRHGKDTVCEMLRDRYGYCFKSSSEFCAEHVVYPVLKDRYGYATMKECYDDRSNHRKEWFDLIAEYNDAEPHRLGSEILDAHDVYCGLRNFHEFNGMKNAGLQFVTIWVDASNRVAPEDASSISVQPWMADFILDNNGDLDALERKLGILMNTIHLNGLCVAAENGGLIL